MESVFCILLLHFSRGLIIKSAQVEGEEKRIRGMSGCRI